MDRSLGLTETIFHRLYGTILAQVVHYFRRYNGDRTTIKNMVRTDITDTILIRLICALGIFSVVSRLTLVRTLNALPQMTKHMCYIDPVLNTHATIISRDVKHFDLHKRGWGVLKHLADSLVI